MRQTRTVVLATVAATASLWGNGAFAIETTYCPELSETADRYFKIEMPDGSGSGCLAYDSGNINGDGDDINDLGYTTLDKSDDATTGAAPGALIITAGSSGTFYVNPALLSGWTNFVIAFKSGNNDFPAWAAFSVPNLLACTFESQCGWTITDGQALSHANIYGTAVPIPAAAWLLGSGLLGLFAVGRRRKTAQVDSV